MVLIAIVTLTLSRYPLDTQTCYMNISLLKMEDQVFIYCKRVENLVRDKKKT